MFQQPSLSAQEFADKNYYLIDSLVLEDLSKTDRLLIDSCLNVYHKTKSDTVKVNAISLIAELCMSEIYVEYVWWLNSFTKDKIKLEKDREKLMFYKKAYSNSINNMGYVYNMQGEIPKALEYYFKSLKIVEEIGDKKGVASNLNNIGYAYDVQGDIPKALKFFHKSLKIREEIGDKKGIANSLNNIGSMYDDQGDIPKALEYHHNSLSLWEEIGNKKGITHSLNNLGSIYNAQRNTTKALEYHYKSLKINKEIGDKSGIAYSLNNIGSVYDDQEDLSKALTYYHKSLKMLEEIGYIKEMASSLNNIGSIYNKQGETSKALEYYHKSLEIKEKLGDKRGVAMSLNNIGFVELNKGGLSELEAAKKHFQKALVLAEELGYPRIISEASKNLSKIYKKQGKGLLALKMYQLHITMRDSINNEATQKATAQQQAKYEYEKQKALDDAESEKLIAIEKEAQAKQKVITYAIAGGLGLVVLFLIFVFNRLRVTKKQKVVIEAQKGEVETQRDEIEEAHKEITDSINYAERIQRSFLATKEVLDENIKDYFVFFKPKEAVSGDFYWAGKLNNGNFAMVNADSTGHGVPGAIMSILNISSIEKAVEQNLVNPSEIFNATRKTIIERLKKDGSAEGGKDGMDASIISFDFANKKFTYTAANNPIWVVRYNSPLKKGVRGIDDSSSENKTLKQVQGDAQDDRNDGKVKTTTQPHNNEREVIVIKADKMPVGKHDNDNISFSQGEFELQKGDVVYTITDGFQDQFGGEKGKKFMVKKLRNLILSISHLPMEEQEQELNNIFFNWKGDEEQVDDVCIIGVRV